MVSSEVVVAKAMEDAHSAHQCRGSSDDDAGVAEVEGADGEKVPDHAPLVTRRAVFASAAAAAAQAPVPRAQAPVPRQKKTKITRFSPDAAPVVSPGGRSYKPIADALTDPSGPLEVRSYEGGISTHTPDNGKSRPSERKKRDDKKIRKFFKNKSPGAIAEMMEEMVEEEEAKPKEAKPKRDRVRSAAELEANSARRKIRRESLTAAETKAKLEAEREAKSG